MGELKKRRHQGMLGQMQTVTRLKDSFQQCRNSSHHLKNVVGKSWSSLVVLDSKASSPVLRKTTMLLLFVNIYRLSRNVVDGTEERAAKRSVPWMASKLSIAQPETHNTGKWQSLTTTS